MVYLRFPKWLQFEEQSLNNIAQIIVFSDRPVSPYPLTPRIFNNALYSAEVQKQIALPWGVGTGM